MGRVTGKRVRRSFGALIEAIERRILLTGLDPSWNGNGTQTEPFPDNSQIDSYNVISLGILSDNKVLALVKHITDFQEPEFFLVRHNADGSVDTTFDEDGILPVAGSTVTGMI